VSETQGAPIRLLIEQIDQSEFQFLGRLLRDSCCDFLPTDPLVTVGTDTHQAQARFFRCTFESTADRDRYAVPRGLVIPTVKTESREDAFQL